jgi:hypothetical protein
VTSIRTIVSPAVFFASLNASSELRNSLMSRAAQRHEAGHRIHPLLQVEVLDRNRVARPEASLGRHRIGRDPKTQKPDLYGRAKCLYYYELRWRAKPDSTANWRIEFFIL